MIDINEYLEDKKRIKQLEKQLRYARIEISHLKARLNVKKAESKKLKIIRLIESGLTPSEIIKIHGFNQYYVYEICQDYKRAGLIRLAKLISE